MDFEKDAESNGQFISDEGTKRLAALAGHQMNLQYTIENLEMELRKAEKELWEVQTVKIPQLMAELGVTGYSLKTGQSIEVKNVVRASIPKDKQEDAFDWLKKHEAGDLIKNTVTLKFGRGEESKAEEVIAELRKKGLAPEQKQEVHFMTLTAFVKERLESGDPVDTDLLGVFQYDLTDITIPGEQKFKRIFKKK